jgi:hypothetical protein
MFTLTYGMAAVSCRSDRGTTLARVGGLVVESAAGEIVRAIEGLSAQCAASGQVVVYSAQVLISPDRLFEAAQASGRAKLPTALVVGPDQIELFRAYSRLALQAGVLKAAFLTEQEAREWLDQAAAVHAYRLARGAQRQSARASSRAEYPA